MNTAHDLAKRGVKIFRAGIWKPRTKPGSFEGIGSEGLKWMKRVKEETGMYTSTEVATAQQLWGGTVEGPWSHGGPDNQSLTP